MDSAIQAHRNEFESERARLSWADTSSPPPNLESLNSQTPVNTDTEGVRIKRVEFRENVGLSFPRDKTNSPSERAYKVGVRKAGFRSNVLGHHLLNTFRYSLFPLSGYLQAMFNMYCS